MTRLLNPRRLRRWWWKAKRLTLAEVLTAAVFTALGFAAAAVALIDQGGAPPATTTTTPEAPLPAVATVLSWRDADTLVTTAGPIRLENIEAPEARPHDRKCDDPHLAAAALAHAQALAPVGSTLTLRFEGRMSWDRHIAWATLPDGRDLGEALLATATVATYPNPSGECPS